MQSETVSFSKSKQPSSGPLPLRILLVEDSAPLRWRLAELLNEPGVMQVTATAESESEAIALINEHSFDVLVVDVELRPGSGIQVVRHARKRWPTEPTPLIIVLTNYSLPVVKDRCLAAGADHFLDKIRQFNSLAPLILALNR